METEKLELLSSPKKLFSSQQCIRGGNFSDSKLQRLKDELVEERMFAFEQVAQFENQSSKHFLLRNNLHSVDKLREYIVKKDETIKRLQEELLQEKAKSHDLQLRLETFLPEYSGGSFAPTTQSISKIEIAQSNARIGTLKKEVACLWNEVMFPKNYESIESDIESCSPCYSENNNNQEENLQTDTMIVQRANLLESSDGKRISWTGFSSNKKTPVLENVTNEIQFFREEITRVSDMLSNERKKLLETMTESIGPKFNRIHTMSIAATDELIENVVKDQKLLFLNEQKQDKYPQYDCDNNASNQLRKMKSLTIVTNTVPQLSPNKSTKRYTTKSPLNNQIQDMESETENESCH